MSSHSLICSFLLFLNCSLTGLLFPAMVLGQQPAVYTASDIAHELEKLRVLGRVLYLAAHPDDENTRLITHLGNEGKYRTAYLSLTRGDGGQNLIGPEIREKLGMIRTQELLQARRIDGGEQFFSRANDFGFSKHPDETFDTWNREQVLSDVVYVIRNFKPDVIITRFNTEPGTTHGHHTASAILAHEAFRLAAEPDSFPKQLEQTAPWQAERLLWNTSAWFFQDRDDFDTTGLLKINVGGYNPYLGKSYTEIAAESRSMHKSQGFGAPLQRGEAIEYLQPQLGSEPGEELFSGIEVSWARVSGGREVGELLEQTINAYDVTKPEAIVPRLLELYQAIQGLPENPYKEEKAEAVKNLIRACLGLYLEAVASEGNTAAGDSVSIRFESINRSSHLVVLEHINLLETGHQISEPQPLPFNKNVNQELKIRIPESMPISQPYWLRHEVQNGMFKLDDEKNTGRPENPPALEAVFTIRLLDSTLEYRMPVVHKYTAPAEGEIYQPFSIIAPVAVNVKLDKLLFASDESQELLVEVVAGRNDVKGELVLDLPPGWRAEPASIPYNLRLKGAGQSFRFRIFPPTKATQADLKVLARYEGETYERGIEFIRYNHIPAQVIFPQAEVKLVRMSLKKRGQRIAYLMGAGDDIPQSLRQVGYQVDILQPAELEFQRLKKYDAIVLGVRAFNTVDELRYRKRALEQYAREGGTVIIQYNTSMGLVDENIAPYPISLSRQRVTVEDAPVRLLQPGHPVFQGPNKITGKDFEGWVQERGLYFADEWSEEWVPLLESHDPDEEPQQGGLLLSKVGKGYYVYTGYSWFRQLPAGVPGAYRIFVNLLSLGKS